MLLFFMFRLNHIHRLSFILCFMSCLAFMINAGIYHYPGNNYFPPNTPLIAFSLMLIYMGTYLQFGKESKLTSTIREVISFFLVTAILVVATNAVQYTPFPPIDAHILALQTHAPFTVEDLLNWSSTHQSIKMALETIYISLTYQMTYLPLFVILMGHITRVREYYFLLLITALIGYGFYYFFPTTAPASMINSIHFNELQRATGLKFSQIHQHIPPTTLEGGMVALPSFHVIWAYLCVYLVRDWRYIFHILLVINLILAAACVILGWHYILDVGASIVVILLGHGVYFLCHRKQQMLSNPNRCINFV